MANVRIKDITTTAPVPNDDDYLAIDGETNGTRKISAANLKKAEDAYDLAFEAASQVDEIKEVFDITETEVIINNEDGSDHYNLGNRCLFSEIIPANAIIENVILPIGAVGGGAFVNVEVWELESDNNTLTRVKLVNPQLTANSTLTIPINHRSSKARYIGIAKYNCNPFYRRNQTDKSMLVDSVNNLDATSLLLSDLSIYPNTCIVGGFNYYVITDMFSEEYKLPIKWRAGIISNSGLIYSSLSGCITDFIIPTSLCDYIEILNTLYTVKICYFNDSIGKPVFSTLTAGLAQKTYIDKSYPYFAVSIFKSWSDTITPDMCDNIVQIYTSVIPNAEGIFEKVYRNSFLLNTFDMCSICHQGYNEDTLGRNRIGGYAKASLRGFTHGECDIKLTSDNKVVCCHDATFVDATSGTTITIANKTLAELQACDYYGTTIATLGEIIEECKRYGLKLFIDQFSMGIVNYACDVISEYNAWDICTLIIAYRNEYPNYASEQVNYIKENYNPNSNFAILSNNLSDYTDALEYAMTIDNAIFYIGQYTNAQLSTLKTIAKDLNGKCKLMVWTVDELNTTLYNALPYINGYCSNVWSGNDLFNPTYNNGM